MNLEQVAVVIDPNLKADIVLIVINILILISFLFFLAISEWISNRILRAGLIGQIIVGLVYGVPVGNILAAEWQETFMALGYIGLVFIIFEGMLVLTYPVRQ